MLAVPLIKSPTAKVTAVKVITGCSKISTVPTAALSVASPTEVDLTSKMARPSAPVKSLITLMRSPERLDVKVTVFPESGFPAKFLTVTVTVDFVTPSAARVAGVTETVEAEAEAETVAVWSTVTVVPCPTVSALPSQSAPFVFIV